MKKFKTIMMAIVAAFTVAGMSSVSAEGQVISGSAADTHTFTIEKTINNAKTKVNGKTFTYTITPDEGNRAGAVANAPTSATVTFTNVTPVSNKAVAEATIDFSSTTFAKNGEYKFLVTETAVSDTANYVLDTTNKYTIMAVVRNATPDGDNGKLGANQAKTIQFFLYDGDSVTNETAKSQKNKLEFSVTPQYKHIEITKEVTGNMADVDQDFTFTVKVGSTGDGTYTVSGSNNGVTELTAGQDTTLTMNHGGKIIIGNGSYEEIPVSTTYSFSEAAVTGYTTTIDNDEKSASGNLTVSATATANNHAVVNDYEGATVTGAFLRVLPYVVIVAIAVAGVVYLVIRNKKQKEVEE